MITKIGKQVLAEMSDDEASSMRTKHLVKGLMFPLPALAGSMAGGAIAGAPGFLIGGGVPTVLGIRHLINAGADKDYLERQKKRNSVIDW